MLGTSVSSSPTALKTGADNHTAMLDNSNDVMHSTPLAKKLFPDGANFDDDVIDSKRTKRSTGSDKRNRKSDTDNDTGVDSDTGSDPGVENDEAETPRVGNPGRTKASEMSEKDRNFSPYGKTTVSHGAKVESKESSDELLMYLEIIEQRALAVESLIEQAKLQTVLNIRNQIEAEFNGLSLEEIPAKCHQKIDRAIQRYLERELEKIRADYESKETGSEPSAATRPGSMGRASASEKLEELERVNGDLREKIESLETSVSRVDMLYSMQKRENEYLAEKVTNLERQLANEKLKYESELRNIKNDYEENIKVEDKFLTGNENSETMASLYRKLEQEEKQNKALRVAGEADQTTIRCLEGKLTELEAELQKSRQRVNDLLDEVHELQTGAERREKRLQEREKQLKEVLDERRTLRETLTMSEHEISLLENKLGSDNNAVWKDSKREILEELTKLEKHIKVIHKEKRKLENKYLAFKIENENLSDSLNSFSKTKDILTPLSSCNVSRQQSTLSSHSSSLSSSLAGSDVEEGESYDSRHVSRSKLSQTGRRRKRNAQDLKDKYVGLD